MIKSVKEKLVLFLSGGAMAGVFGAGVVTRLQELNFYDNIEAIYASSVGGLNAAYFLTGQSKLGSSIYWEDLTKNFIRPGNLFLGAFQRLLHCPQKLNVINIDYVFEIIKNKKKLNIAKLKSNVKYPFLSTRKCIALLGEFGNRVV